jgi:hypothetical protein
MVLGDKLLISEVVLSQLVIRLLLPPLGIDRCIRQAMGVLLGHLSSLTRLHKLTLEKDDLLNKALCILTSRGQRYDTLHHHSQHPLPSPLSARAARSSASLKRVTTLSYEAAAS